jgi:hypothetical protein
MDRQTQHAFTLDIANIDFNDGNSVTTDPVAVCVDDVQSAQFDPDADGGNGGVLYDFGSNEFYFVVAAANFSGAYHLRARLTNLQGGSGLAVADGQTAEIFWTDSWQDMLDNTDLSQAGPIDADGEFDLDYILAPEDLAVGQEGQMLYLKLVIYHNSFEATDIGGYDYTLATLAKSLAIEILLASTTKPPKGCCRDQLLNLFLRVYCCQTHQLPNLLA